MRRLFFLGLFALCFAVGLALSQAGRHRDVYRTICDLTAGHFYKDNEKLVSWVRECRLKAAQIPITTTVAQLLAGVQDHMNELNVSHFSIYTPVEDRKLWRGESVDTGIRARYIEDHLVVYHVFTDSAAAKAGVRAGDEIKRLPGSDQVTPWGAEHRAGVFHLLRKGQPLEIAIAPASIIVDASPVLTALSRDTGLLTISSFRAEFFEREAWLKVAAQLANYKHVVIDVRENAGGNFVAMLRALSTFTCGERVVGRLLQPRKSAPDRDGFDDNTQDAHQIELLEHYHSLGLKTFDGYGCFKGRVTVLISSETASVAEIFADSFKYRPNARVWGQPSAGDVVLAVWYDLPALGMGYSFSIPEAIYLNQAKKELEGEGVFPQKELFYDLQTALRGQDNWLIEAVTR